MHNAGTGSWPRRRARMSPDKVAFVYQGQSWTYAEVHQRTTRLADRLRTLDVAKGDRVAYLGPNHPAFAESMFATHLLGAIFVPLNFRLAAPEIDYMLRQSDAKVLIYAPACAHLIRALEDGLEHEGVVALADPRPGELDYESWLAAGSADPLDEDVSLDDIAMMLYTSGTTGRPKGATLSHANLVWNCFNIMLDVDVASDEVTLVSAPLFHVAALDQTLLPTFMKGATSVIMPAWDVDECFDLIDKYDVTWMFGVAAMFAGLVQSPRWEAADLSSLRNLMTGGAPVPESLIAAYQERGLVFCQGYGLTETAPGATFLAEDMSERKAGSAGVASFFVDVRVVRPDLRDVDPGEPGEVLIKGPNVTPGYWNNPGATAAAFTEDGWFRSGDLATRDEDGYLYIVDRVKDMYISGGENVYPAEIESALFAHPAVAECAVIGVPDEKWGEVGHAFVILRPGHTASAQDLRDFLMGRIAKYKVPLYYDFVQELPRTGSGKVQKAKLRERVSQTCAGTRVVAGEEGDGSAGDSE
jgi:fatty-acyl-CoA synthase